MSKYCCIIELEEILVELNSRSQKPKAKFLLKSDNNLFSNYKKSRRILLKYRAMVKNSINVKTICLRTSINKNNELEFYIPKNCIGLEIQIKIKTGHKCYTLLRHYSPANCKGDFQDKNLSTRLMIRHCNNTCIDTSGLDHTPITDGEDRTYGHQLGPHRSSRAMAISHIAMFEAVISIIGGYKSYLNLPRINKKASLEAAISQATHDTLIVLYPSHKNRLDQLLINELAQIKDSAAKINGINAGKIAASTILQLRKNDFSDYLEEKIGIDYFPQDQLGIWQQDPISQHPLALGSRWSEVTPFVIPSASHYRSPPPPVLDSIDYQNAFNEVKALGGDGIITSTVRSDEATEIGIYWAYDGTPSLCAPPRMYNQIAMQIALDQNLETIELLHLLTVLNVGLADTGISAWETKYFYKFWRPITAIRHADNDGNIATIGDNQWTPLGAPASNSTSSDFTPPFPEL